LDAIDMWISHLQQLTALQNPQKNRRKMFYATGRVREMKGLAEEIE